MLIVGGGIAGSTLRLALHGSDWEVDLVKRDPSAVGRGAGIAVQPNAMRALRGLRIASAVEAAGQIVRCFRYRNQRDTLLCEIDLDRLWGAWARSSASGGALYTTR